jgi:hypothetical protein
MQVPPPEAEPRQCRRHLRATGIVIQMFRQDHPPPPFHALYAEHEALIDIRTLAGADGLTASGLYVASRRHL